MTNDVTQVLEWEGTDGVKRSFLIVEDKSLPKEDIKRKTIELSEYNSEQEEWMTQETLDYIDAVESYGIPKSLID